MNKEEMMNNHKILEIQCGSHLYGTSVPTSDVDYVGIFIAPKPYYIGMEKIEEVDLSIVSKGEDGKNDSDAIDRKFYELRKFIHLAMGGNPNIIEMLFVNDTNVVCCTEAGQLLRDNAELFSSQLVRNKYLGYSYGQKKMMVNKPENFLQTTKALAWLREWIDKGGDSRTKIAAVLDTMVTERLADNHLTHLTIGNANYNASMTVRKLTALLTEKVAKITNRQELWTKYGYDTKFAMHLLRLLFEGIEIMTTGRIEFPLKERDFLLEVRAGKYTKEQILIQADELELELINLESTIQKEPDFNQINNLLMSMVEDSWEDQFDAYYRELT